MKVRERALPVKGRIKARAKKNSQEGGGVVCLVIQVQAGPNRGWKKEWKIVLPEAARGPGLALH